LVPALPPLITSVAVTAATVDEPFQYDVNAFDPNGDALTFTLVTAPAAMTIDTTVGMINWMPTTGNLGDNAVVVRAQEPGGLWSDQAFTVTVSEVADPTPPPGVGDPPQEAPLPEGLPDSGSDGSKSGGGCSLLRD